MVRTLKNIAHYLISVAAVIFYMYPARRLTVIGVTGTDGKTTTTTLIAHILKKAGKKVSYVSTLEAKIGDMTYDMGFHVTTPTAWQIQKLMAQAVRNGSEYFVLEVTSHSIDQYRTVGCNFYITVLTNITHEHLDYHGTLENYAKVKTKFLGTGKIAVINGDDESIGMVMDILSRKSKVKKLFYRLQRETDFLADEINFSPKGTDFLCVFKDDQGKESSFRYTTPLLGVYNVYNCLAAVSVTTTLGVKVPQIQDGLTTMPQLPGRFEVISEGQNFTVVVDFAHTPNALENVLNLIRSFHKGRIITVFGSAGLRDKEKRPIMGEISARLATITVLTAEDPRTESARDIMNEIFEGCKKAGGKENETVFLIEDRARAIQFACGELGQEGDFVIITGKGHEKSMCYGTVEKPWSDQDEVRKALKARPEIR